MFVKLVDYCLPICVRFIPLLVTRSNVINCTSVAPCLISLAVPLLLIGVANPRNARWNGSCWVLIASCALSHLFVPDQVWPHQIPLLLITEANPQNVGWNSFCWVLTAGRASSRLFVPDQVRPHQFPLLLIGVANPQNAWVSLIWVEYIRETPGVPSWVLTSQLVQNSFSIDIVIASPIDRTAPLLTWQPDRFQIQIRLLEYQPRISTCSSTGPVSNSKSTTHLFLLADRISFKFTSIDCR